MNGWMDGWIKTNGGKCCRYRPSTHLDLKDSRKEDHRHVYIYIDTYMEIGMYVCMYLKVY